MSRKLKHTATPLTAAIAAALNPGMVSAQDQDQDQDSAGGAILEEVIVTATRRDVAMQDLPQSVQAFSAEAIQRNAFTDFNDVANAIPSLTLVQNMPGRNSVKFRGASTGTGEYYTAATAAVYLDETPLTFNSQQLWPAMVDIERIESLPGPQGTLFGSASVAGTIRVITRQPDPTPTGVSGEVYGEYFGTKGGDDSWALNGWVNIPLVADTLALRLVAHTRDEGGWIDNVLDTPFVIPDQTRFVAPGSTADFVQDDWNSYTLTGGRGSLLWNMTDNWQAVVALISEETDSKGNWSETSHLPDNQSAIFHDEVRNDEWWNASLLLTGDLGFATLVSSTTFLDREISYEFENMIYEQWKDSYFGYLQAYYDYTYYGLYNSEYTFGWYFNDQTQDRFSQEIRLTSQSDSRFQWMVGAFYEKINDDWFYGTDNPDLMNTLQWYYANYWAYYYNYYGYDVQYPLAPTTLAYTQRLDRTFEQLAFFGEVSYSFNDHWTLTGGARWFEFTQDYQEQNQFPEGLPPFGTFDSNGIYQVKSTTDDVAFKLALDYAINDDMLVYGLFSQGFRAGGQNSIRAVNNPNSTLPLNYLPDFMDNYELGFKSTLLDGRMRFNAIFFRMEWNDIQQSESAGAWYLRGTTNRGESTTDGIELDMDWQVTENFRLEATATFLDAEHETGYTMPNAPDQAYFLAADYTLPWQPWDGDLWTRISYAYGAEWWNSETNSIENDPRGLVPDWSTTNLQVGLSLPNQWTLTAFVNNLTDESRVTQRWDNSYASDWFGTDKYAFADFQVRPRNYGITLRKRFN